MARVVRSNSRARSLMVYVVAMGWGRLRAAWRSAAAGNPIRVDVDVNVNSPLHPSMNTLEAQLHYPLGDALPAPGASLEVAPGVRWVRMALPFALDHINLWLLRDEIDGRAGWTVVDCCVSRDEARAQWEQVFASS